MSCFAYWDIIPNSCLLLAQSPQEKASFPYSALRVPRIFSAEGKTKIKMMMSTITLCFKDSISLFLNSGCELCQRAPTKPFPLVSWIFLCATISQLLIPLGISTPRSQPEEYQPSSLPDAPQIFGGCGGCSDTSWALPGHLQAMSPELVGTRAKGPRDSSSLSVLQLPLTALLSSSD